MSNILEQVTSSAPPPPPRVKSQADPGNNEYRDYTPDKRRDHRGVRRRSIEDLAKPKQRREDRKPPEAKIRIGGGNSSSQDVFWGDR